MHETLFSQIDFGPLLPYLNSDDVTDISYSNNGQIWLKHYLVVSLGLKILK